jgi:hypothetical protein
MHVRATYTIRALYWEQVSIGADHVLISDLIREEENRQAHAPRLFVGNPFDPENFFRMNLPLPHSVAQQESDPNTS